MLARVYGVLVRWKFHEKSDKKYEERVIDTPVSESAVTGMAVGASLTGGLPIVVHPRIDFMLYAMDAIVNQAAKWHHDGRSKQCLPYSKRNN